MTADWHDAVMEAHSRAAWIPRTKLTRPLPAADAVLDPALVARLTAAVTTAPLTLIRAAGGAGKTTLAAAVADAVGMPSVWIRLDDLDDDPATVLDLLVLALEPIMTGGCPAVRQLLDTGLPAASDPRRAVGVLVNDLIASGPSPLLLVLDDLHVLADPRSLAVLDYLVDHLPASAHVLATSRTEPALAITRLRATRRLVEVRDDDLRLSLAQADSLLNGQLGLELSEEAVARAVATTGGWVTGLRLLSGPVGDLDAYLEDELLSREPAELRSFLLDTSVLDLLTPTACAAVTGRSDSAAILHALQRRHSLLVQVVDPIAPAYRYHDLLGSFLARRLVSTDPLRLALLHLAAAGVSESPPRRIEHLIAAEAWEDAAEAVTAAAGAFPRPADLQRLAAWADRLPAAAVGFVPRLRMITGLAAAQRGDLVAAVADLEPALAMLDPADTAGQWTVARTLHVATLDHAQYVPMLRHAEASPAFAAFPPGARADHHLSLAYGALFTGRLDETARRVEVAVAAAMGSGDLPAAEVLAQHLSPLLTSAPGVVAMIDTYAEWTAVRFPDDAPLVALGRYHQQAFVALLRGQMDAAVTAARLAGPMIARLGGLPYLRGTVDWVLAGAAFARGDLVAGDAALRSAIDAPAATDLDRRLDVLRRVLLARILRQQGRVAELAATAARAELDDVEGPDSHAAQASLSIRTQWRWAVGDLSGAAELLQASLHADAGARVVPFLISPRLDLALLLDRSGRRDAALAEVATVTGAAAALGTPWLLAAPGPEIAALLRAHGGRTAATALSVIDVGGRPAPVDVPGGPAVLSGREVEVLRLLGSGASNAAVAAALVVSHNTVKSHVRSVLTKLGAHSRGEAVAIARRNHLL